MNRPASPGQLRFFLLDGQDGGAARTLVKHLTVIGPLGPDRLRRALSSVVAAHPALRTSLHLAEGRLVQWQHPVDEVPLVVSRTTDPDAELAAARAALAVPFRHGAGPLCAIRALVGERLTHCLIAVHHAVFDDDSTEILFSALVDAYEADERVALTANGSSGDAPMGDGAEQPDAADSAEPAAPAGAELARLRTYWAEQLAGAPPRTELPWMVETLGRRREACERALPAEVAAALRKRARQHGFSPFAQFLSSVGMVVSWYLDRDDVVFAVPVSGRSAGGEQRIDCLQNTVPVRLSLTNADTSTVLDRTMDALLDALDQSRLPFEGILESARAVRPPGRKPLAQILITETRPVPERDTAGLRWSVRETVPNEVEYDACLALCHTPNGGMRVELSFRAGSLPTMRAEHTVDHVVRLLTRLSRGTMEPLAALDLLNKAERHELAVLDGSLSDSTASDAVAHADAAKAGTPRPQVINRILRHSRTTPEATALLQGKEEVSYRELTRRSATVAAELARHGVRQGDRVGVCLPHTPDLVAVLLGVWRAGALYVPLDPDYPADRLGYIAEHAMLAAVVVDPGAPEPESVYPAPAVLELSELRLRWSAPQAPGFMDGDVAPSSAGDPAYLIYTSGSTGKPKGVVVRHGELSSLCDALDEVLPHAPVAVAGTSTSFDISALELFWPLTRGRTVLLTRHRYVAREPVPEAALYQCTPTVARILAQDADGRALLARLGALLVGGEPLSSDLADELAVLVPGPVLNCYGPTETTVWSTMWRVRDGARVSIGRPLPGESCHVVDSLGRLLPPGCPGRLVITGSGVAEGYWRRPDLTKECFAELPGARGRIGYDTGDLVVLDNPDGLRFLGRRDNQCKILGQRIELEEVEAALRRTPGTADVAVAPDAASTSLVAFLVGPVQQHTGSTRHGGRTNTIDEASHRGNLPFLLADDRIEALRTAAESWLPQAMVPTVWCRVDALPQLPNGKLDRATLAIWAAAPLPGARTHTPDEQPETPVRSTYAQVQQVWERVLGRQIPVCEHDTTFFDLGGSSAGVLRVFAALHSHHPGLTVGELFRHTTLGSLAIHLEKVEQPSRPKATLSAAGAAGAAPLAQTGSTRGHDRSRAVGAWRARRRAGTGATTRRNDQSNPSRSEK